MDHKCCIPRLKPLLNQGQHYRRVIWAEQTENRTTAQGFFFSDESNHCISFWNQGPESDDSGEAQNPICLKSSTFVHSQWGFGPLCSLLLLVRCVSSCPYSTQHLLGGVEGILQHFMFLPADKHCRNVDVLFQQNCESTHSAKTTTSRLSDLGIAPFV